MPIPSKKEIDMSMRKALILSYDGSNYHGWQTQPNGKTVQETLEEVFSQINKNQRIEVLGCGRTDAGVHASQFVAHIDLTEKVLQQKDLLYKINIMLPKDVALRAIVDVKNEFHARFDAIERSYTYAIHFRKDPFLLGRSWYHPQPLDVDSMQKACEYLLGQQDFKSFSKARTQVNNFICDLKKAHFEVNQDRLLFQISANRFLRNMVRAIVGTLVEVGAGKRVPSEVKNIIDSKDRSQAGQSAPAEGLYLSKIDYPDFSSNDYF